MKIKNILSVMIASAVLAGSTLVPVYAESERVTVSMTSTSATSGNTFEWYLPEKKINVRMQNITSDNQTLNVKFSLVNDQKRVYFEQEQTISFSKGGLKTVTIDIGEVKHCDIYTLCVDVENADKSIDAELEAGTVAIVKTDENGIKNENVGFAAHLEWWNINNQNLGVDMLRKSNVYGIRSNFDWNSMEQVEGILDFELSNMNNVVKKLQQNNMKLIPILSGPSEFYVTDGDGDGEIWDVMPTTPKQLDGWRRYVKYTAEQLEPYGIKEYEVWNEPDNTYFNETNARGAEYTELLKIAKEEIEKVDKTAKIGAAALTGIDGEEYGKKYFTEIMTAGGAQYMDAITLHPYIDENKAVEESTKVESINWYIEEFAKHNNTVIPEIWHTEVGYSSAMDGIDEYRKGALNTKTALLYESLGLGDKIMLYNFAKKGTDVNDKENQYGHVSPAVTSGVSYIPTPAYVMVTGMNYVMGQSEADSIYNSLNGNVRALTYNSTKFDGKKVMALYAVRDAEMVSLNLGVDCVTYYDSLGNSQELVGNNGQFVVYANDAPCYIVGDFDNVEFAEDSFVSINNNVIDAADNECVSIAFTKNVDKVYTFEVATPKNASLIRAGRFSDKNTSVLLKNNASVGEIGRITVKVMDGANVAAMFDVDINTTSVGTVNETLGIITDAKTTYKSGERVQIGVDFINYSQDAVNMTAMYDLYLDNELVRSDRENHCIDAGSVSHDTLIVPETKAGNYKLIITVLEGENTLVSEVVTYTKKQELTDNVYTISGTIPQALSGIRASMTVFTYDNDNYNVDEETFSGIYIDQTTTGVGGNFNFKIRVPSNHIRVYIVPEGGEAIDFTFSPQRDGQTITPYLARGMVKAECVSADDSVLTSFMTELSGMEEDIEYDAYCVLYKADRMISIIKTPSTVTAGDLVYENYGSIAAENGVDFDSIKLLLWAKNGVDPLCVPYED